MAVIIEDINKYMGNNIALRVRRKFDSLFTSLKE